MDNKQLVAMLVGVIYEAEHEAIDECSIWDVEPENRLPLVYYMAGLNALAAILVGKVRNAWPEEPDQNQG